MMTARQVFSPRLQYNVFARKQNNMLRGARPPRTHTEPSELGSWIHGWQKPAARVLNKFYRGRLLCSLSPSSRALLRSQAGAHAREWLRAIPARAHSSCRWICKSLSGDAFACRYPWRQPVAVDMASQAAEPWGNSWATSAACARSGLLARRAPISPIFSHTRGSMGSRRAGSRRRRRAGGPPTMARTTAPGVAQITGADSTSSYLVIYGASRRGEAPCCDVTLVSPLGADGRPQPAS